MEQIDALDTLAALSHETRLTAFRQLVAAGHDGLSAGGLADHLGVLPNTLSTHLAQLTRAGLIDAMREGRTIRYTARFSRMHELMDFLLRDCCGGQPELCQALSASLDETAA